MRRSVGALFLVIAVLVQSDRVVEPTAVRFAFSDTAVVNLMNGDGLPASLFRSDAVAPTQTSAER